MPEILFDEDDSLVQYIRPDPYGVTLRTQYKGTQEALDRNQMLRNAAPSTFRADGVEFHHVASVPAEVYDLLYHRLGRAPTAEELLKLSQDRDFCKLRTREVKL